MYSYTRPLPLIVCTFALIIYGITFGQSNIDRQKEFQFASTAPCDGDESNSHLSGTCLERKISPGLKVTILADPLCYGVTGDAIEVLDPWETWIGTQILNSSCGEAEIYGAALLDQEVQSFDEIPLKPLQDQEMKQRLIGDMRKDSQIESFFNASNYYLFFEDERQNSNPNEPQYPFDVRQATAKNGIVYFIEHPLGSPLIIFHNNAYSLLTEDPDLCSRIMNLFQVNNRYFIKGLHCYCGTDNCAYDFVEIE